MPGDIGRILALAGQIQRLSESAQTKMAPVARDIDAALKANGEALGQESSHGRNIANLLTNADARIDDAVIFLRLAIKEASLAANRVAGL